MPASSLVAALLYCRPGFEKECAAEISEQAAALGVHGYAKARPDSGYVLHVAHDPADIALLAQELRFQDLVFARQLIYCRSRIDGLPATDRVAPLVAAVKPLAAAFSQVWLETADTNEAKELSGFCRKFAPHLERALERAGCLRRGRADAPRLHLFFLDSSSCYAGLSFPGNSSPWPMGIPRLRIPRAAPSRSAAKLVEAFHTLMSEEERSARLKPGMGAVDLGAAPGGWSWYLASRGLRVTAVDNGPMDKALLAGGLVEQVKTDGFTFRPQRPVDWLVCDMVEQPVRIAALVGQWLARGWCRAAVFNLKLPMNKRYEEVKRCRTAIDQQLRVRGVDAELRMKQLYHDREEVTGYLQRLRVE
ncbi:MAG: 23S rRNA (cytidine(2498)-2'-O)-methyltransferase RlmM [Pseudomonadota bacterium]